MLGLIALSVRAVACGIWALSGQTVPTGAVPVLPPGGFSMPIRLATLRPLLGKLPSVAGVSAPRDDRKAASQQMTLRHRRLCFRRGVYLAARRGYAAMSPEKETVRFNCCHALFPFILSSLFANRVFGAPVLEQPVNECTQQLFWPHLLHPVHRRAPFLFWAGCARGSHHT